jgi:Zn-dependent M28 family amino/carboxypeptidase
MHRRRLDILGRWRTIFLMRFGSWKISLAAVALAGCVSHSEPKDAKAPPANSTVVVRVSKPAGPAASDADPKDTVPYLASDELQGRGVGLPGLDAAAQFIAGEFAADGLRPLPGQTDYFQAFDYTTQASPGRATELAIGDKKLNLDTDYLPMRFSGAAKFSGTVVFAGYGVSAPEAGYDDYAGMDVKGKIVIAMRYEPMDEHGQSRLAPRGDASGWSDHATFSAKARTAAEHGAAALMLVSPPDSEPDLLVPFSGAFGAPAAIPVLEVKQAVVDEVLAAGAAPNLKSLRDQINASFRPRSVALSSPIVSGTVQIESLTARVKNVMGVLPGAGPHADEFVMVGAHYDHLGLGTLGHLFGPVGSIYHGADDNASGTATVLELASRFAHAPPPARSIIFICFTAEEEGLIGSDYFVKHPPVPLEKIVAMVNLDMVGRIKDQTLYIGGQGTAADFDAILGKADMESPLRLKSIGRGGLGPSDHMSFALRHVPVMFFFSGIHVDYHRPTDTSDKINYGGIGEVADFTAKVVDGLTRMPRESYLVEADKDSMHLFGAPNFSPGGERRVILGVIPDYGSQESHVGVLISGTTPGTPAEAAGMLGGDLLVQFGNQKLENLIDLSEALSKSKPGEKVRVKVIRGDKALSFDVTLAERKG